MQHKKLFATWNKKLYDWRQQRKRYIRFHLVLWPVNHFRPPHLFAWLQILPPNNLWMWCDQLVIVHVTCIVLYTTELSLLLRLILWYACVYIVCLRIRIKMTRILNGTIELITMTIGNLFVRTHRTLSHTHTSIYDTVGMLVKAVAAATSYLNGSPHSHVNT